MEKYKELGRIHTEKDIEVGDMEIAETEKLLNGHVSMLLKVGSFGENWKHEQRMRESCIQHSKCVSSEYFLLKDHKKVAEGELPQTRPVVSGCAGMGVSLSNILSEFVEAIANDMDEGYEVISSEDFLSRVNIANRELEKEWRSRTDEGWEKAEEEIVLIGADVKALFPSMLARITGRSVGEAVKNSRIQFEGINYTEAARYVWFGMSEIDIMERGLARIVLR